MAQQQQQGLRQQQQQGLRQQQQQGLMQQQQQRMVQQHPPLLQPIVLQEPEATQPVLLDLQLPLQLNAALSLLQARSGLVKRLPAKAPSGSVWRVDDRGENRDKDTASYQREVYKITQPPIAFSFTSHTFLSLVGSKRKWKSKKAQLVSHGMRGSF